MTLVQLSPAAIPGALHHETIYGGPQETAPHPAAVLIRLPVRQCVVIVQGLRGWEDSAYGHSTGFAETGKM